MSVVVIAYNIPRQLPRTLQSLGPGCQIGIDPRDYEVIVVDNDSSPAVDAAWIRSLPGRFRLIRIDPAPQSPVAAANAGIRAARGEVIGLMIDGARMVTPGLVHFADCGARAAPKAVVTALGWYLGSDYQRWSMRAGHGPEREDELLAAIGWPQDGYRLFDISTLDESCRHGWFHPGNESNALFMHRDSWRALGPLDERFDAPGGGLVNLDLYRRALAMEGAQPVILLGEGSFHQFHNGVATNHPPEDFGEKLHGWHEQYRHIRGGDMPPVASASPIYLGRLPQAALAHFVHGATHPGFDLPPPLGPAYDPALGGAGPLHFASDPVLTGVLNIAHAEMRDSHYAAAASVARLASQRAPAEEEPRRILRLCAGHLPDSVDLLPSELRGRCHAALGDALALFGDTGSAAGHYRRALESTFDDARARIGLAAIQMPGPSYLEWLNRLYNLPGSESVVEIGVGDGASLGQAAPPRTLIGIDPNPRVLGPVPTQTRIFPLTSDAFFAAHDLKALLGGRPFDCAFIDGLHQFEQVLVDFMNLEKAAGPRSLILMHDTLPLDDLSQQRQRRTRFWTGDVWKAALCLRELRPDLGVFTIPARPSGLTVVTGMDPSSRVLEENFQPAIARYSALSFAAARDGLRTALNVIPNEWAEAERRLAGIGVAPGGLSQPAVLPEPRATQEFWSVDPDWYVGQYPDAAEAIANGFFASAEDHYRKVGERERRLPARPHFDEDYYLATYPDIPPAIARGEFASGLDHYIHCGYRENRSPAPS